MVFQEFRMLEKLERLFINLKEFGELKPVVCRRSSERKWNTNVNALIIP
jgi:hypothetical protein